MLICTGNEVIELMKLLLKFPPFKLNIQIDSFTN